MLPKEWIDAVYTFQYVQTQADLYTWIGEMQKQGLRMIDIMDVWTLTNLSVMLCGVGQTIILAGHTVDTHNRRLATSHQLNNKWASSQSGECAFYNKTFLHGAFTVMLIGTGTSTQHLCPWQEGGVGPHSRTCKSKILTWFIIFPHSILHRWQHQKD